MSKVLTKQVQNNISSYFFQLKKQLTKPEFHCARDMTIGILKSCSVLVSIFIKLKFVRMISSPEHRSFPASLMVYFDENRLQDCKFEAFKILMKFTICAFVRKKCLPGRPMSIS